MVASARNQSKRYETKGFRWLQPKALFAYVGPLSVFLGCELYLLELCVALDEFFRAATGKPDRDAAIIAEAFDADHRAEAKGRMADLPADHGVCVGESFQNQRSF